jgi:sulfopyruvate decarboxylase subunit alpha
MTHGDKMTTVSKELLDQLKKNGANFFVSVPCKLLGGMIDLLAEDDQVDYVPATREEEGLGICAGAYLGGKQPVLIMQNTGIGTLITSLCSLGLHYHLPIPMIISHRGSPGEPIGAQVPMGNAAKPLLDTIGIPTFMYSHRRAIPEVASLVQYAQVAQRPVAALLDFNFWRS